MLGTAGAVDVELSLQGLVGQERWNGDGPSFRARQLVGGIARPAHEYAHLPLRRGRPQVRVLDAVEAALVREALVLERFEEQLERLVVERADVLEAHARLGRDPAV